MVEVDPRTASVVELVARMQSYLADGARGGHEITDLVGHLGQLGEVGIFGGMPRDIARVGADAFKSDVDLVVDAPPESLAELLRSSRARTNRFGGYRIDGNRHSYDVWSLSSTWAVKAGHVRASRLQHLVHTTFFDCDAVVYLCKARRIHHGPQFETWLRKRIVDVNLEANPNPAGAVTRALRVIADWNNTPGPGLIRFLGRFAATQATGLDADTARRLRGILDNFAYGPVAVAGRPRGRRVSRLSKGLREPAAG